MEKNEITKRSVYVSGLQIREAEEGKQSRKITGYAIVFNSPFVMYSDDAEEVREIISPSAITREVLDSNDFVMTMFHDNQLVLARSKNGEGTLRYNVDERGVAFEFDAPRTVDGDKALELVRRGDIDGCSFAFTTDYRDKSCVSSKRETIEDKIVTTYCVERVDCIWDFTLTPNPAYETTECSCRDLVNSLRDAESVDASADKSEVEEQKAEQDGPIADAPRIQQYQKMI